MRNLRSPYFRPLDVLDYPMVLELHDPPLLVETDETGPLEPVPTMMQVLADVHAIREVAKKPPG